MTDLYLWNTTPVMIIKNNGDYELNIEWTNQIAKKNYDELNELLIIELKSINEIPF